MHEIIPYLTLLIFTCPITLLFSFLFFHNYFHITISKYLVDIILSKVFQPLIKIVHPTLGYTIRHIVSGIVNHSFPFWFAMILITIYFSILSEPFYDLN